MILAKQQQTGLILGFSWLHVVDLNGAVAGKPVNRNAVESIIASVKGRMAIQLGGGIHTLSQIETWLAAGLSRVILGLSRWKTLILCVLLLRLFPGQIVVGLDARNGLVATQGWLETSDVSALDLAKAFEDSGVAALIYTDIDRDGALTGVNIPATLELAQAVSVPVIASGGLRDMDDLRALKNAGSISGVISGKALYDGRLDPAHAMEFLA